MSIDFYDKQPLCVINCRIKKYPRLISCSPSVRPELFWVLSIGLGLDRYVPCVWRTLGWLSGSLQPGSRVIYVTSIERLPICIMKCYKSVQNVDSNGNIEMMYSSSPHCCSKLTPAQERARKEDQPTLLGNNVRRRIICFYFFFAVDIEINGWYPNGRQYSDVLS